MINEVRPYTKASRERLVAMINALALIDRNGIAGDIVECGVWRAGHIILARKLSPLRVCWLYDTFAGMTKPGPLDHTRGGAQAVASYEKRKGIWADASVEEVAENLARCGVFDERLLRFVVGPVEETLLVEDNLPDRIALLRLDTDWHASTKVELEVLYPRLVRGGVLIVDDYGHWLGARKAVDDYFGNDTRALKHIDYTAVMMVKP